MHFTTSVGAIIFFILYVIISIATARNTFSADYLFKSGPMLYSMNVIFFIGNTLFLIMWTFFYVVPYLFSLKITI